MENETSPVQENNSCVDEFLQYSKYSDETSGKSDYYRPFGVEFIEDKSKEWFNKFCKELELLREMSKVVNNYMEYLKTKIEQ